jgi:hypothetical protein
MRKRIGYVLLVCLMAVLQLPGRAEGPQRRAGARAEGTVRPLAALISGSGALNGGTPTAMAGRFDLTTSPTTACAAAETGLNRYYNAVPFTSDANGNATLVYSGECASAAPGFPLTYVTIHRAPFDASTICSNFVWGMAAGTTTPRTFTIPANTPMVMVVSAYIGGNDVNCTYSYSLNSTAVVPTMGRWAVMALAVLLAVAGVRGLRRRGLRTHA